MNVFCVNCGKAYPEQGVVYRCVSCGGLFDYRDILPYQGEIPQKGLGIWRFSPNFGLPEQMPQVTLGEGDTPLVWADVNGRRIAFKCEFLNPTGSFKDRGSAVIAGFLSSRGVRNAVEDSSGNAGASIAAYAARAGIKVKIFVPDTTSGPKMKQIEAYGAEIVPVPGARSNASAAVQHAAKQGLVYASHAYLPFNLPGYATIAYELFDQLGTAPGTVICPVGQGGLLLGIGRGFLALQRAGIISRFPLLVGIQASACAPLWAAFAYGHAGLQFVTERETVAEGIRVSAPLRGDEILGFVETRGGFFVAVDDTDIIKGRDELAKRGFYVETTSAVIWQVLLTNGPRLLDPIVVILTGSGLKNVL